MEQRTLFFSDIAYGSEPKQKLDLYLPNGKDFPVIVYFHGGALEGCDKADEWYAGMAKHFAESGYAFASVNYRLYTEGAAYPDFIEDCARATAFVRAHICEYGGNGTIMVAGQSAGAWIALMLCVNGAFLRTHGVENADIAAWIIDSAQTTSHFNVLEREKGTDRRSQRIDEFAPLFYVNQELRFGKMFLDWYEDDMAGRAAQNELFVSTVKEFCPQADIKCVRFGGEHCRASTMLDENGEYPFVRVVLQWLEESFEKRSV